MTSADITAKLDSLESRAAGYVGTPGPAGEFQQRASGIVADRMVTFYRRDGQPHHWEIESRAGRIAVAFTRVEAERAVAA